ncbi:MAG: hypothetical protein ABID45_04240 [Patescibacteria group bacterium]
MKKILFGLTLSLLVLLFLPYVSNAQAALPTPTLLAPTESEVSPINKPVIRGVTKNDTRVAVYIDNVFNGYADVANGDQGTASFVYFPFLDLAPGTHAVKVRAENTDTGKRSDVSSETSFFIEHPFPAPEIHYTTENSNTTWAKPYISGVAQDNSTVQIYIDGKLNGEFLVMNSGTGTASFSYKPFLALSPGKHTASAVAISPGGKKSVASEQFSFSIIKPEEASIDSVVTTSADETTEPENEILDTIEEELEAELIEDVEEEAVEEELMTPVEEEVVEEEVIEEEAEEVVTVEKVSEEENKEEVTEEENKSSVIGWVLLGAIAIALVWRNRKGFSMMMKKDHEDANFTKDAKEEDSKSVEVIPKEQNSSEASAKEKDEQKSLDI